MALCRGNARALAELSPPSHISLPKLGNADYKVHLGKARTRSAKTSETVPAPIRAPQLSAEHPLR